MLAKAVGAAPRNQMGTRRIGLAHGCGSAFKLGDFAMEGRKKRRDIRRMMVLARLGGGGVALAFGNGRSL
jgi:hypothetical protein